MAERSQFWNTGTTGDGTTTITQAQTTEWANDTFTPRAGTSPNPNTSQGVLRGVMNELAVTGTASPVSVAAGAAYVAGFFYKNDAAVSVTIPTPTGNTRIDRIVLRASYGTTRTVRITRIAGTEGSGSPPALTQTVNTTWDIPLARVSITTGGVITITDDRAFAQFATNHVKRDGDTMTGGLTIDLGASSAAPLTLTGAAPVLTQIETDQAANNRRWIIAPVNGTLWGAAVNDAGNVITRWVEVERSGTTIPLLRFLADAITLTGNTLNTNASTINYTASTTNVTGTTINHTAPTTTFAGTTVNFTAPTTTFAGTTVNYTAPTTNVTGNTINHTASTTTFAGTTINFTATNVQRSGNNVLHEGIIAPLRRLGGDANNWSTPGNNSYTPGSWRIQVGATSISIIGSSSSADSIAYPIPFANNPIVFVSCSIGTGDRIGIVSVNVAGPSWFSFRIRYPDNTAQFTATVYWLAIGPA
jgi:hypothetical protein